MVVRSCAVNDSAPLGFLRVQPHASRYGPQSRIYLLQPWNELYLPAAVACIQCGLLKCSAVQQSLLKVLHLCMLSLPKRLRSLGSSSEPLPA